MSEQFKIGDRVTWVHSGRSSWSIRTGTIEAIEGDIASIRYGKKTLCQVPLSALNEAAERKIGWIVESLR